MGTGERVEFVHRSWPADPAQLVRIRRELAGWLGPLRLSTEEIERVVLAVDEAAANVVCHAYGPGGAGEVELTLWTEAAPRTGGTTLCIEVADHGSWRPPAAEPVTGGRGIGLMSAMTDATLIHYDGRGSRVLLRHGVTGGRGVTGPVPG